MNQRECTAWRLKGRGPGPKTSLLRLGWLGCRLLCLLLVLSAVGTAPVPAQTSVEVETSRWQSAFDRFGEADRARPPEPGGVLFLGSSSIRLWDLERYVPITRGTNRGFGGSQISDSIAGFDVLVKPHRPAHLVFYAGDNDIAAGESAQSVVKDFQQLADMVRKSSPGVVIYYVAIKPSLARWELWPTMADVNRGIEQLAAMADDLVYVDIATPMMGQDGKPRPELFVKDGLHLSHEGYLLWSRVLMSVLPVRHEELVFPLDDPKAEKHNHGSSLVETPSGDLLVSWFHGSGERKSDDVGILGARWSRTSGKFGASFVMADTPGFPDTNGALLIDAEGGLRLFYPTILDNHWESALMKMRWASAGSWESLERAPDWQLSEVLHFKQVAGDDFPTVVETKTLEYFESLGFSASERDKWPESMRQWLDSNLERAADKLDRRLGWFGRAHPLTLSDGRIVMGLYSDGFSFGIAALSDDGGRTFRLGEPIVGGGSVQPSFAERSDGTIVAFMRDNGPPPKRVLVAESDDRGASWGVVRDQEDLLESGAGLEVLVLDDGRWLVVHNNLEKGRGRLAISISNDQGRSFERAWVAEEGDGRYHYPSLLQARDGSLHLTYSYHPASGQRSIKHQWLTVAVLDRGE